MNVTARKDDGGKPDRSLIDRSFKDELCRVLEHGVRKYGRNNWRKPGLSINRLCAAMERHNDAIMAGEDIDDESGYLHSAHIAASAMFITAHTRGGFPEGFDDRYRSGVPSLRDGVPSNSVKDVKEGVSLPEVQQEGEAGQPNPEGKGLLHSTGFSDMGDTSTGEDAGGGESTSDEWHSNDPALELDKLEHMAVIRRVGAISKIDILIPKTDSIFALQREIKEWADSLWPNRKAMTALTKMQMEEIPELIVGGLEASELADIGILLFDIAALQRIDLGKAIRDKMKINRKRSWKVNPDTGLAHHIEGGNDNERGNDENG